MKMTRELQRHIKELKKIAENAEKSIAKKYGYKRISGFTYKVKNDMLIWLDWTIAIDREAQELMWTIYIKAPALDDIFWDILLMKDEVSAKPFSFHVNGAFTSDYITARKYRSSLPDEFTSDFFESEFIEADRQVEAVFNEIPDISAFESAIDKLDKPDIHKVDKILCCIYRGDLKEALSISEKSISSGEIGQYVNLIEGEGKDFYNLAAEYCRKKCSGL